MTDPGGRRRLAGAVRVSLAEVLGADIDGAWWPYTASMGRELPDLVNTLRPVLGDVVDIRINWTATSPTPMLTTMPLPASARMGPSTAHHRLMVLVGSACRTRILVVPSLTPTSLATMVMRRSARRPIPESDRGSTVLDAADRVVRAAQAQSAGWSPAPSGVCGDAVTD